jgi:MbtH protein
MDAERCTWSTQIAADLRTGPRTAAVAPPLSSINRSLDMAAQDTEDTRTYIVLVNHEEQYSLWLAHKPIPLGWSAVGKPGTKAECLAYVGEVWTDMRPLSLREQSASTAPE